MAQDVPAQESDTTSNMARLLRGLLPALVTVAAALYSLLAVCRADAQTASEAQWQTVAEEVRKGRTETELIVFAPDWVDPVGRQYLGDQMTIAMAARMDSARFTGIWEVALGGARAPETRSLDADATLTVGPLTLRHYPQTAADVAFDFTAKWREGKATGAVQGRPSLGLQEVGFEPHKCIKVVPRPGETAVVTFSDVPLGSQLVGYVGLADIFTRRDVRAPGRLALLVNGKMMAEVRAGIDDGWRRFEVGTTPGRAEVAFHLTAVGAMARDRRICFAAEARN